MFLVAVVDVGQKRALCHGAAKQYEGLGGAPNVSRDSFHFLRL